MQTQSIISQDLLEQILNESDIVKKQQLEVELWKQAETQGTPLLKLQKNGEYQLTFLYQLSDEATIKLECGDL